jgi:hypothetical protein
LRRNQLIRFISKESEEIEVKKSRSEEEDGQKQKKILMRKISTVKQEQTDEY